MRLTSARKVAERAMPSRNNSGHARILRPDARLAPRLADVRGERGRGDEDSTTQEQADDAWCSPAPITRLTEDNNE